MASRKEYAYKIKGDKIELVEKDYTNIDDGLNYTYSSGSGIDIPSGGTVYKSPLSDVTDGLQLEYSYIPDYYINDFADVITFTVAAGSQISIINGQLVLDDGSLNTNWSALDPVVGVGSNVLLLGAGKWSGLHKVASVITGILAFDTTRAELQDAVTNTYPITSDIKLYYNLSVLEDESDYINLPRYLSQALVYYVKAKLAEDALNIEMKEYFMREFRRMVEKHENAKVAGPRRVMPGGHAIR
tara:strand:+ start:191 stop:919 length:729 start_codon:yes stop_codon:yes gene_type:complete